MILYLLLGVMRPKDGFDAQAEIWVKYRAKLKPSLSAVKIQREPEAKLKSFNAQC